MIKEININSILEFVNENYTKITMALAIFIIIVFLAIGSVSF